MTTTTAVRRTPAAALASLFAVLTIGLLAGLLGGSALAPSSAETRPPVAPRVAGDTVTEVTGDADNGFTIHRVDGSTISPPTASEARAECGEYDRRIRRARCRADVRRWYADLAVLQQTIDYYQLLLR